MNSPEVCQCCPGLDIFTSSRYFSRQKDLHIRSGCNERYFRRPGNLQIKNRSFALFYGSRGHLANMAISISQLSPAPFSKIHIFPESSLCVDSWKMLVPKDTIKNCASTLLYFTKRVESHLFVTWRPSYSKIYLVRFSVVHQSNLFAIISFSLGFSFTFWLFYAPASVPWSTLSSFQRLSIIIYKPDVAGPSFAFTIMLWNFWSCSPHLD